MAIGTKSDVYGKCKTNCKLVNLWRKKSIRTTRPKAYVCPEVSIIGMSDFDTFLLATSIGQFNDMGAGGSLGGDILS